MPPCFSPHELYYLPPPLHKYVYVYIYIYIYIYVHANASLVSDIAIVKINCLTTLGK